MRELTSPNLIHLKAALFLLLGALSAGTIVAICPTLEVAVLLVAAVWAFARLYFYAFYVIEHFVDPSFRYSGLLSVVRYFARRTRAPSRAEYERRDSR
jgi:hypothetical protein